MNSMRATRSLSTLSCWVARFTSCQLVESRSYVDRVEIAQRPPIADPDSSPGEKAGSMVSSCYKDAKIKKIARMDPPLLSWKRLGLLTRVDNYNDTLAEMKCHVKADKFMTSWPTWPATEIQNLFCGFQSCQLPATTQSLVKSDSWKLSWRRCKLVNMVLAPWCRKQMLTPRKNQVT